MQQLRREMSTAGAKANSACQIGRVSQIGEGHSKAHWLANIRGRGIIGGIGEFIRQMIIKQPRMTSTSLSSL